MYQALRAVKVTPPPLQLKDVQRPRLLAMLDRAIERPVTLICAGPGYGKTVLVNQWASARRHGVVWVSLDPADDREARFWTLVQYALQQHGLLGNPSPQDPGHSVAEHAIEELAEAASRADDLLILVLDDVHVLGDHDVMATLDTLLRRPPPKLRVIMTALSDPVLPLHRYRIQGHLSEIRAAELAMTMPEIEELLDLHNLHLAPAEVQTLADQTEGWVAGLRLAAMQMEDSPEPGRSITDFAMDRGSIGEYLMEEVLATQSREAQELLVRTSICDPISGPLADAICETESGVTVLNELAAKNALVTALDHEGARFRYHPLLREVLRHLLHREPAAVQRRGHENAARWYALDGSPVEALQHAVAAQDWELSSELLCRGAFEEIYVRAPTHTISGISRFVDATPADGPDEFPQAVAAAQAAVAVAIGRYDRAKVLLLNLEPARLSGGAVALHAYAQLVVARQEGDAACLEEAAAALGEHDANGPFGTFGLYEKGSLHLWRGSDNLAESLLEQALKQATEASLHAIALRCVGRLAISHCTAGRVGVAEEYLTQGAALLQAHPWVSEEFRVAYHLAGAEVALMHGDLDLYSRFLLLVDAAPAPGTDPALSLMHGQIQAKGLQNAGRYAEARDILLSNKGRDLPNAWVLKARAEIVLLELQAQMGRPRKALERLASLAQVHESLTSRALSALAKAHCLDGDLEAAEHVARRIITAHPSPPMYILIDALLLSSEVADARGEETSAVESATTAVQLAAADRVLLPFIPAGPRLRGLLERHPALSKAWPLPMEDTPGRWARELPASPGDQQPSEALTEREISILNWLTTTMTMAEIATELYVSTNTVKTHVAAIYRKLEATNRREAIARGRQLRLI